MSVDEASGRSLAGAINNLGYEILPFKGTFDNVLTHVPREVRLTVTASPQKGLAASLALTTALARQGYDVVPHLSARMMRDAHELDDVLAQLSEHNVTGLFVVGGDGQPAGAYSDALSLLNDIHASKWRFTDIGIGGYPEGHALIQDASLDDALAAKIPLAHHLTTQICFDPARIERWAASIAARGLTIPIRVGVPGAVSRQKLLRISGTIGLGDSAKFLQRQQNLLWRFFMPGGYNPARIVRAVAPAVMSSSLISGIHVFTFNDLKNTERWRQAMIRKQSA